MHVINALDINDAYLKGHDLIKSFGALTSTRAGDAYVVPSPVTTIYHNPCYRVLYDPVRDANPFFHFFEALWVLAGRQDVATLAFFNARMVDYSDDGEVFHAPYGYRIRNHFAEDQLLMAIENLNGNQSSRQVVLQIWDTDLDLAGSSKDIPCNDMVKLRVVNGLLDIVVFCRSNDMIWGAYGANIVQFSTLQEFIAGALGVPVGRYYQVSCDFHAYVDTLNKCPKPSPFDAYKVLPKPYPMFNGWTVGGHIGFLRGVENFMGVVRSFATDFEDPTGDSFGPVPDYITDVATPMLNAWIAFKNKDNPDRHSAAIKEMMQCHAEDWRTAGIAWLARRGPK